MKPAVQGKLFETIQFGAWNLKLLTPLHHIIIII
jgi:hypothetical protein